METIGLDWIFHATKTDEFSEKFQWGAHRALEFGVQRTILHFSFHIAFFCSSDEIKMRGQYIKAITIHFMSNA